MVNISIDTWWQTIILFLFAYFIGCFNFSLLLGKKHGVDISKQGSGNLGATNARRVMGNKFGIFVLIGDVLKAVFTFGILTLIKEYAWNSLLLPICQFGCVVGHIFPFYNNFKGGKGGATAFASIICINWVVGGSAFALFLLVFAITRYVSLSMISGMIAMLILGWIPQIIELSLVLNLDPLPWWITSISITLMTLLVIVKHKSNIISLLEGKELKEKINNNN